MGELACASRNTTTCEELWGWESVEMVRRYAHLSSEHLAEYVDRLSALRPIDDPIGYDLAIVNKKGL